MMQSRETQTTCGPNDGVISRWRTRRDTYQDQARQAAASGDTESALYFARKAAEVTVAIVALSALTYCAIEWL
jgi:hypothetical protein